MSDQSIITRFENGALWITLNRPQAMNAITPAMVREIDNALDAAARRPGVRAIVLAATGAAFCAGADLKFAQAGFHDDITVDNAGAGTPPGADSAASDFLESLLRVMKRLEQAPQPVIAAVNGLALAGGLELVLCCDLVIAARSARLGDAHANYGLLPGGGASARLPRKIGPTRAKYLLFTGDFLPAEYFLQAGLVNAVVDDDELEQAVLSLVEKIAAKSPLGLRRMKSLVDDGLEQPLETALRLELLASEVHRHSFDQEEGLAAFNEKRKPQFLGR